MQIYKLLLKMEKAGRCIRQKTIIIRAESADNALKILHTDYQDYLDIYEQRGCSIIVEIKEKGDE